jgi:predicted KAP-like P-loop ATPase
MINNYSSDRPISNQNEDRFQRYGLSKRIARTIIDREMRECIVIGIYGAWGEGKTSVINLIETELKLEENILVIKFNPWRYNDENSLLIQFFQKLADSLNKDIITKLEKAGKFIEKYGKLVPIELPFIGNIGEKAESLGKNLKEVDTEVLKERVEKIIVETNLKIVILIDDIDRLDKNEIHSIFRLVKLTADFTNTTYILSFDEDMVAAAIGERFGAGNKESGQNFLEKIIQVPITIPVAQPAALNEFCFEMINRILDSNKIELSENEVKRFISEFSNNLLNKLKTPRLAVRYVNTLSFSLPLLYGEVNLVDLMLFEAIKIFYPSHYEFIKENPDYFILSYSNTYSHVKDNDKINSVKKELEKLALGLTKLQNKSIERLLCHLFPTLNEVLSNYYNHSGNSNDWFKNKRIASSRYFNKYFSYSVIKGELSDVQFESFLSLFSTLSIQDVSEEMLRMISNSSADSFLYKMRSKEEDLDWANSIKIAKAIAINSSYFPRSTGFTFGLGYDSPNDQAAIFIYHIIKNHSDSEDQFKLAKDILEIANPFEFSYKINNWLNTGKTIEEKLFSEEQYIEMAMRLIERAKMEANDLPIFEKFPDHVIDLIELWAKHNKNELEKYIENIFLSDSSKCNSLLITFTPTAYSTAVVGPYKVDFDKQQYDFLTSMIDRNIINNAIDNTYTESQLKEEEVKWGGRHESIQTTINIVRQFKRWHDEK